MVRSIRLASLGPYEEAVGRALSRLDEERVVRRIWDLDHTVWKPAPAEIADRLGWLSVAEAMRTKAARLGTLAGSVCRADRDGPCFTRAVLLGMGGSSLAPELFRETFRGTSRDAASRGLDLTVLDSTVPASVFAVDDGLDPARTLFIVATKSGGTVETLSLFRYFYGRVAHAVGTQDAGSRFVAITDPGSSLAETAERLGFRARFLNDPKIGGRYSALSYFGLVPAAVVGADVPRLLESALAMARACGPDVPAAESPAAWLGTVLGVLGLAGRDKVTFAVSPEIAGLGDWVEQLIAESTGKEGRGILPVVGEPLGSPDVYGDDRLFVGIRLGGDATHDAALDALEASGHPVVRLSLSDPYDLGEQIFLWEMATAVAGHHLGINPFDQPDVESAKIRAREMVAAYREMGTLPASAPTITEDGVDVYADAVAGSIGEVLSAFLGQAAPGDYVALQAYLEPTPETTEALTALRLLVRDRLRIATTAGYGPRFLHSTGQLHKGDAGNGLFIQLTAADPRDLPIPDDAGSPESSMTFGVIRDAQAAGDRQALADAGRRVIRFDLGSDVGGGLARLLTAAGHRG
jgi:transaldolase/glucose-6-phosphate isomerase